MQRTHSGVLVMRSGEEEMGSWGQVAQEHIEGDIVPLRQSHTDITPKSNLKEIGWCGNISRFQLCCDTK